MTPSFIGQVFSFKANRVPRNVQDQLRRGKACLRCRRKKMKCDGVRPVCTPCKKRNTSQDCEYMDVPGTSRSDRLEENLARLQAMVKELEAPVTVNTKPHQSPTKVTESNTATPSESVGSPDMDYRSDSEPSVASPGPWWEWPPSDVASILIRHFLPNACQLGFSMNVSKFLSTLSVGHCSSLFNSIFLWAIHLSPSEDNKDQKEFYLNRALAAFDEFPRISNDCSSNEHMFSESILHTIQAGVLIAQYLFSQNRYIEARDISRAAVSLALQYGFHNPSSVYPQDVGSSGHAELEGPTRNIITARNVEEYGERLNVFWAIYNVDRSWAICGESNIWEDDPFAGVQIDAPWPLDLQQYEKTNALVSGDGTIARFLAGHPPIPGNDDSSFAAMRVKATALYSRSSELYLAMCASKNNLLATQLFHHQASFHHQIVQNYAQELPSLQYMRTSIESSDSRRTVAVVYCMVHCSLLLLHQNQARAGDEEAARICLRAADEIILVFEFRDDSSLGLLDPVLGTVGVKLAEVYIDELHRARQAPDSEEKDKRIASLDLRLDRVSYATDVGSSLPVYDKLCPRIHEILKRRYD